MNPIVEAYLLAKEKALLVYLKDLQEGQIRQCLLDFIEVIESNSEQERIILSYMRVRNIKTIQDVKNSCKPDDFKSIITFLKKGSSPNKPGTIQLTKMLLEFDITTSKAVKEIIKIPKDTRLNTAEILKHLVEVYLKSPNFNSIKINGDVDGKIGVLSMEEYYILLSYISYEDTYNRDSLLKLEKEYSYSKWSDTISPNELSQDYITENIINNNKVIISGNPGVGKSTYAKWLCYKWAKNLKSKEQNKTIIYIQLRDINFETEDYLIKYINTTYFSTTPFKVITLKDIETYQLILDGFDELTNKNRSKISSLIKSLNYIVLSRPYGLINHSLNYDIAIQIDGFNTICVELYLDKILKSEEEKEMLLNLIDSNRVLKDYANIPLMLSYITLIFLTSKQEDIKEELSTIKSIYDLQEKVFSWILSYALEKGSIEKHELLDVKHKIEEFAYFMQINKYFIYTGGFDNSNTKIVEVLSAIGLGSQKRTSRDAYHWQFNFNTVTFQEFLAARYLSRENLNAEAMVYLVTDSFFWNFCIMLVGMQSHNDTSNNIHQNSTTLIDVLEFLYNFHLKNKHPYYGYAYYMLLAECSDEIITEVIKKEDLSLIIMFYKQVYYDEFWSTIIYQSINKIIGKLPYQLQYNFVEELRNKIIDISNLINKELEASGAYFYLSNLLTIGTRYNEKIIFKPIMEVLIKASKQIKLLSEETELDKYDNVYESEDEKLIDTYEILVSKEIKYRNNLIPLFLDLPLFSLSTLLPFREDIIAIYNEERSFGMLEGIVCEIATVKSISTINEQYELILNFKEKNNLQNELIQEEYYYMVLELIEDLYIVIKADNNFETKERNKIVSYLDFVAKDLIDTTNYEHIEDFYLGHLIDICIMNLTLIDIPQLYRLLFDLVIRFEATIFKRIPNEHKFTAYITKLIKTNKKTLDIDSIRELVIILNSTPNIRAYFFKYRTLIFHLFKAFAQHYKTILVNNKKDKVYVEAKETMIDLVGVLNKNYDKKYFLEAIETNNLDFVYTLDNGSVLKALATNFIFYEDKYWDLFIDFFNTINWDVSTVLSFVENEDLFLFKSNHSKLISIFINLFEKENNYSTKELDENGSDVLVFSSRILTCLKQYEDKLHKNRVLKIMQTVLSNKVLLKLCYFEVADLTPVDYFLAYILFYFFNPFQEELLVKMNINVQLESEPGAKTLFLDRIITFAENKNYGIEIYEIEKFRLVLGEAFYNELLELIEQRLINKNKYSPKHFEMLLKNGTDLKSLYN